MEYRQKQELPIDGLLPELLEKLAEQKNAVLIAAPGAGKTTRVPLALLGAPWLDGQRIVMLEPRRLAARAAARYMANSLGEQPGGTVGYRVRLDTKVGPNTRIEVITEGVFTRMLQADPALEGIGIVIFDEFHERHLHSDLGLALSLQSQSVFREDLRLLVMSATLDAEPVADLLGGAPVIVSEGRAYPVDTHYAIKRMEGRVEEAVALLVADAMNKHDGDALVFLPGAGEIRRVQRLLGAAGLSANIRVMPLYGSMPPEAQDHAVAACVDGERKIVLASTIAESSVTVRGVRIVVDSGLSRVPRFSARTGMTRLETVPVSVASADQRRGRAGREAPGVCYRLWTEMEHRALIPQSEPELLSADLAPLALELAIWGIDDPAAELAWLNKPPAAAYTQALNLLRELDALDAQRHPTAHGRAMAELGMHPRLAHMVLEAIKLGYGAVACELAALLSDRDPLRASRSSDMRLRLDALHGRATSGAELDEAASRRIAAEAKEWMRAAGIHTNKNGSSLGSEGISDRNIACCGLLIALAYPDRIAKRREDGRFLLRNGRGAAIQELQQLSGSSYLAVAELEDIGADCRILLAAPLTQAEIEQHFASQLEVETEVRWERSAEAVRARRRVKLGSLILKEGMLADPNPSLVADALLSGIAEQGLDLLPWSKPARQLQARIELMRSHNLTWPDVSETTLIASLNEWLSPYIGGMRSRSDLGRLNMTAIMESQLSWQERQQLDEEVPTHLTVPSGSRIPVDYSDPAAPFLAVRLQELFGLRQTPLIAGGKLPVTIHLLSPAHRPVQVTKDLASFWQQTYFDVKKDLKGRYPKHYWPDNPLEATPTNRAKPRTW
ncbi:ATP-dependent helicase HrpB [Paenibacillus baekrokdamisoli]|uniref:ATP-dependent helicase HrpB n=1 Tax=Paenibacillus baekrokdamisoli TaxID=1712516 RepID=A0A3G9J2B2_9BACL|nr:ATP-dependent helicase HrpB [Paenibacillus baekrokdamisoli]MBB3070620.1 ATP-dependent helicase HrpB [Paenibacillus baekrokdamisoli]BBH19971.1 ATP-dependent helicase HrpB [Paenibacillus baekrokdamisoli]